MANCARYAMQKENTMHGFVEDVVKIWTEMKQYYTIPVWNGSTFNALE